MGLIMIDPEMFLHLGGCDEANQYKSTGRKVFGREA